MDNRKYDNKIAELRAWSKDDTVPADLQWLCEAAAKILEQLQAELAKLVLAYRKTQKELENCSCTCSLVMERNFEEALKEEPTII